MRVLADLRQDLAGPLAGYGGGRPSAEDLRAAGWRSPAEQYPRLLRADERLGAWADILASCAGDRRALAAAVRAAQAADVRFPGPVSRRRREDLPPPATENADGRRWTF